MNTTNPTTGLTAADFGPGWSDWTETIREILINDDWLPADAVDDLECDQKDIRWIPERGWDAFKPLDRDDTDRARPSHQRNILVCRWDCSEIHVTACTRNLLIDAEVTFPNSETGVKMFAAMLAGLSAA